MMRPIDKGNTPYEKISKYQDAEPVKDCQKKRHLNVPWWKNMVMADTNFVGYYLVDGCITDTI